LVSDIPAGGGKLVNIFLRCRQGEWHIPKKRGERRLILVRVVISR
jgi:hypothetical protein